MLRDVLSDVQVVSRFDELVEDGHAARDALVKIFNKKIKRSKQKDAGSLDHPSAHTFLGRLYSDIRHTDIMHAIEYIHHLFMIGSDLLEDLCAGVVCPTTASVVGACHLSPPMLCCQ